MAGWIPVRKILRAAFGPGGYQILRTGEIRVLRAGVWEHFGSLLSDATLQALRGYAATRERLGAAER